MGFCELGRKEFRGRYQGIDDLSDWGENLVKSNHPGELPQFEVLLEEGYYKMKGEAKFVKVEDGINWYEVELEELGNVLRKL